MNKKNGKFKNSDNYGKHKKSGYRHLKPCPECDGLGIYTITKNEEVDGIVFSHKYLCCEICGWEREIKIRGENTRFVFDNV